MDQHWKLQYMQSLVAARKSLRLDTPADRYRGTIYKRIHATWLADEPLKRLDDQGKLRDRLNKQCQ